MRPLARFYSDVPGGPEHKIDAIVDSTSWHDTIYTMLDRLYNSADPKLEIAIALTGLYITVNLNNNNNFISKRSEFYKLISQLQNQT